MKNSAMFSSLSNDNVISSYFIDSFQAIFVLARSFGFMPFYYYSDKLKFVHQFRYSSICAVLSCISTLILSGFLIYTMIDYILDATRFFRSIDKYMAVADSSLVALCLITSTVTVIIRRNSLILFVNRLTKVDEMLHLKDASIPKRNTLLMIFVMTLMMFIKCGYAFYVLRFVLPEVTNHKLNYISFVPYYVSYYSLLVVNVLYWSVADGLSRRLRALNKQMAPLLHAGGADCQGKHNASFKVVKNTNEDKLKELMNDQHIAMMIKLYEYLIEALMMFNRLFGPTILVLLVNILINMILRPYFVYYYLLNQSVVQLLLLHFFWVLFHVSRLIFIIEPAQNLSNELEDIRMVVRKLLSFISITNKDNSEQQIEIFAKKILLLSTDAFRPCGMFSVTRGVYTSVLGTVLTYLVIVINFYK